MNTAINELVKAVIHKNSLSECSVGELEKLVAQYPYFGPAQYLLAQKLKQENPSLYERQSQRALLYFQDHLWYDYMSRNEDIQGTISTARSTEVPAETPPDSEITEPGELMQTDTILPAETGTTETEEPVAGDLPEEVTTGIAETNEIAPALPPDPIPAVESIKDEQEEPVAHITSEEKENNTTEEPVPESESGEKAPALPQFRIEPVAAGSAALTFEPFHTVDYFASQGIRFKEEEKPKDRFGIQLKSFTEWLKTLKKLPESEPAVPAAPPEDKKVTQMAEHSLADREVVTEAMADVWEKQGNSEKAIETYRKLSLLNPVKSAYFAAKIEHLKSS